MTFRDLSHLRPRRELPQCEDCAAGRHGECIDIAINLGAVDALDFCPPICGCRDGECDPYGGEPSYACSEWMHNCPGCSCWCHQSEDARRMSRECHQRWSARQWVEVER